MQREENALLVAIGRLNDKMDVMTTDIKDLKGEVKELKSDMTQVKSDIVGLKNDMTQVKSDIVGLKNDVKKLDSLETEVKSLHFDVVELKLTCENDLNKQIRIIAEGHGNLLRHFEYALEKKAELEQYAVKVIYLEGEVRRLKHYFFNERLLA